MSIVITAKVIVTNVSPSGEGDERYARIEIGPDYGAGANREWAYYTPGLSYVMTVRGEVADHFPVGRRFTATFTPDDEQ